MDTNVESQELMNPHTEVPGTDAPQFYTPGLVTELGPVPSVTLGWLKKDRADDTEYWY